MHPLHPQAKPMCINSHLHEAYIYTADQLAAVARRISRVRRPLDCHSVPSDLPPLYGAASSKETVIVNKSNVICTFVTTKHVQETRVSRE